jgi:hypothetical protein
VWFARSIKTIIQKIVRHDSYNIKFSTQKAVNPESKFKMPGSTLSMHALSAVRHNSRIRFRIWPSPSDYVNYIPTAIVPGMADPEHAGTKGVV